MHRPVTATDANFLPLAVCSFVTFSYA